MPDRNGLSANGPSRTPSTATPTTAGHRYAQELPPAARNQTQDPGTAPDPSPVSTAELANYFDHTLLKPEATDADVASLITEAADLGAYSVCVSPSMLPLELPQGTALKIAVDEEAR